MQTLVIAWRDDKGDGDGDGDTLPRYFDIRSFFNAYAVPPGHGPFLGGAGLPLALDRVAFIRGVPPYLAELLQILGLTEYGVGTHTEQTPDGT
jgi:hypothetical protein